MRQLYFDYNATTPIAPVVQQAMLPFLAEQYGNPSSSHALGRAAHEAIEDAREYLAGLIGCDPDELVGVAADESSEVLASIFDGFVGRATQSVAAGRIAVLLRQEREHGLLHDRGD